MNERRLEGQYAGFLSRAVGLLLDYVILVALVIGAFLLTMLLFRAFDISLITCQVGDSTFSLARLACMGGRGFLVLVTVLVGPLYFVLFWTLVGQTIGQRVMGVRVVRLDGRRLGIGRSLLRWLGYQLCIVTIGIGFLWVLVDDRRMGWHDKLARTCAIYSWNAVQHQRVVDGMSRRFRRNSPGATQVDVAQAVPAGPGLPDGDPGA